MIINLSYRYLGIIGSVRPTMRELVTSEQKRTDCSNMNFLSEVQRKLCGQERRLPRVISDGASIGIQECKHQFANRRWNCSTYNSTDVFGGILKKSMLHSYLMNILINHHIIIRWFYLWKLTSFLEWKFSKKKKLYFTLTFNIYLGTSHHIDKRAENFSPVFCSDVLTFD